MQTIGVIGAGTMGTGVAQTLVQAGYKVILIDISDKILKNAKQEINNNVRMQSLLRQNKTTDQFDMTRIGFDTDYNHLSNCPFVIENVTEDFEIKTRVYDRLNSVLDSSCIIGVNTSVFSISKMASLIDHPERVVGAHFMNPVPLKPMVEVVRGFHTSDDTIEKFKQLLNSMDKSCVVVNDYPGFATNRVFMLMINEAIFLVQDKVAKAEEIDLLFKQCFSHKMGPLETADLIGLDTILNSITALYTSFNDSKYRPCPLLRKMVDAGLLGRKSGQGFYSYKTNL